MTNQDRIKARIEFLYERFTNATATRAELDEFFELAADPANEPVFESLMSGSWDELHEKSLELEEAKLAPVQSIVREKVYHRPFRWIAAAAVTVLLGLTAYFLFFNKNIKSDSGGKDLDRTVASVNEIGPGANKAVLTLSNGSSIILDSARNGTIAEQGNTKIIKSDSGKLAYQNFTNNKPTVGSTNTLSTPRGGQFQVQLPDGTRVWLNAASSITYPTAFTGKERRVTITGEAYFEVVHNKKQPFTVSVNGTEVHDIGTRFNINAYPDESGVNTTLIEGSVQVAGKILKPGQQSQIAGNVNNVVQADLDYTMAWLDGKLQLSHGDVKKLFREISRWYDVDVEYSGAVPQEQFSASIKRNLPLSNLLSVLNAYGISTKMENRKIIVQ